MGTSRQVSPKRNIPPSDRLRVLPIVVRRVFVPPVPPLHVCQYKNTVHVLCAQSDQYHSRGRTGAAA